MKDRISIFLKSKELTSSRLAELIGVQPSSISHIISGRNKPGFDFLAKMIQVFPDLSPDWLLLGNGEMYRHSDEAKQKTELLEPQREISFASTLFEHEEISDFPKSKRNRNKLDKTEFISTDESHEHAPQSSNVAGGNQSDHITHIVVCFDDKTFSIYRQRKN